MRMEGVYQVNKTSPVRIAVSITKAETLALISLLTPDTQLLYESSPDTLKKLGTDLLQMAVRRGWLHERVGKSGAED